MTTKQHAKAQESAVTQRLEIEFEDVIQVVFSFSCGPKAQKLIGRHFDDLTVLRAADALEKAGNWRKR